MLPPPPAVKVPVSAMPVTPDRWMPASSVPVDETESRTTLRVPPWSMSIAWPVPEIATLEIVRVPTVPPPSSMPSAVAASGLDVEAPERVVLGERDALAGAGHHDGRRRAGRKDA